MADLRALLETNLKLRPMLKKRLVRSKLWSRSPASMSAGWTGIRDQQQVCRAECRPEQVVRAATASSLDEFVQSAEFGEFADALREGSVLCAEFEGTLNSTEARNLFADTAWMPSDLTDIAHAVIGYESFLGDVGDLATVFNP